MFAMARLLTPWFFLAGTTDDFWHIMILIGIAIGFLAVIVFLFVLSMYFRNWLQAMSSGVPVGIPSMIAMTLRKVPPGAIVQQLITAHKANLGDAVTRERLESHYMAGGNIARVVRAMIEAHKAHSQKSNLGIDLSWDQACAIDLAGRDVLEAVNTSINPKVIDCPLPTATRNTIDGVARNGIQLKVRARITVRTNLAQLIGGAGEETVIARVGEGIVAAIGNNDTYEDVLAAPDKISHYVMNAGLETETAFSILSVDIADIDVGENIGARLKAETAETEKRIAQAKAEERRAMAVAEEQEMIAAVARNRAEVVLAESKVPIAIAEAFKSGNLGIMDYYKMKNIIADTSMRENISKTDDGGSQ
ncbi:MAG: flotillin-like protein FloA [Planctomycetota bacterium]